MSTNDIFAQFFDPIFLAYTASPTLIWSLTSQQRFSPMKGAVPCFFLSAGSRAVL